MKTLRFIIIQLGILTTLFVIGVFGNTVSLDTTFNGTGYSLQSVIPQDSTGESMVLQPDGKILIAGNTDDNSNTQTSDHFAVIRLNSDGTLDTSFGTNGKVLTQVGISASNGKLWLQPDGKILLAGKTYTEGTFDDFAIIRYNSDGSLDTSFNKIGYAVQSFDKLSSDHLRDVALQADGKIILVGRTGQVGMPSFEYNVGIMRFNSNGSLDTTFNTTGMRIYGTEAASEEGQAVTTQADGKIIVGGYYRQYDSTTGRVQVLRLNSDGSTDSSFGNNGTTITFVGNGPTGINALAFQSDGKIVAAGGSYVTRYATNGNLDTSFGVNGVATVNAEINEIELDSKDKILLASKFGANGGVVRLMANGASDTNFNSGRFSIRFEGSSSCTAKSVAIQSDDKVLLGGSCRLGGVNKFLAFRLEEIRTKRFLDFDGDSITDISIYRPSNGQWWYLRFLFTQTVAGQFGTATDLPVPADFSGDGRTDIAVYRPSTHQWFIARSDDNSVYSFEFGASSDIPVAADYDGDNIADPAVFRPSDGVWYILKSTGGISYTPFGLAEDKPVPSDYDGDFITDIAIYRPSTGVWWIKRSSDQSVVAFQFGTSTDTPVPGDYTGDNKTDGAFWRASTGEWFILRSEDFSYYSIPFGLSDDLPVPGNYTGDSRTDIVIYRPSTNIWHVLSAEGNYFNKEFGSPGDIPIPNTFVP